MDPRGDIDQLAQALMPPYEQRLEWPDDAQDTVDRLFGVLVGMYLANRLTAREIRDLVDQLSNRHEPDQR